MTGILAPYGNADLAETLAKVGKGKSGVSQALVARMPSAEVAAKVGGPIDMINTRRVVRRKA